MDPKTVEIALGSAVATLTIVGTIFGWFRKLWTWLRALLRKAPSATIEVPRKTIILQPGPGPSSFWWQMGSSDGKAAMQVVGALTTTNVCKCEILITAAKLKKPRARGNVGVRDIDSYYYGSYMLPVGGITDLKFDFWIIPPVREKGEIFKADVAILDQFGNEHWMKGIEFKYLG